MNKKTTLIALSLVAALAIVWTLVQNKRQHDFERQPPVIQAVSEIEKNLKESDQKAK